MKDPIKNLHSLGQSLWYDNIQRRMLENGNLQRMIQAGELRGMTSNPSIFNQAIAKSSDYDEALKTMAWGGLSTEQILDRLILEDIRIAADLFQPLYKQSKGEDGYVSVEVRPELARDTEGTLVEARRLWGLVNRPNVMIKIPATQEGIPAVRQAISEGMNINVTLIFSLTRYAEVMEAYLNGLEQRVQQGKPVSQIASVASFFVSRIDNKADPLVDKILREEGENASLAAEIKGRMAVASAKLAYELFTETFSGERFQRLKEHGARLQRPLWASTSTKNPDYPDTMYVDELIGPNSVNTVPQSTLDAFRSHGKAAATIEKGLEEARKTFAAAEKSHISMEKITAELEEEGVKSFADAFQSLLNTVDQRRKAAAAELGDLAPAVAERVEKFQAAEFPARLRSYDPTLWSKKSAAKHEIRNRLGWLTLPEKSRDLLPEIRYFIDAIKKAGYKNALLLGMGGSSLAPEVNRKVLGTVPGNLDLVILDSTDPEQVCEADCWNVATTLYVVSSKSGDTPEVKALMDYFWHRAKETLGNHAPEHFVAITDPETPLEELANARHFRRVFHGDPKVGGRYSALSAFGLVPAALTGIDLDHLLDRASWMMRQCAAEVPAARNPGMVMGAILGEAALQGRDKLTLISGSLLAPFGAWLEQMLAESSGKAGKGIVPIIGETPRKPEDYGSDRLFVYLRYANSPETGDLDQHAGNLIEAGYPVLTVAVQDPYDIGAEYYRWGIASAMACAVLGVNAFDQPDVQDNKDRTVAKINTFHATHQLEEIEPAKSQDGIKIYGRTVPEGNTPADVLNSFLQQAAPGEYVAVNAYLPRLPEVEQKLQVLRDTIFNLTKLPVMVGFGPRFLHSTGQLHKGGPDSGIFIQLTADHPDDINIPGESGMSFGTLQNAQALGDYEALQARGRRLIRFHLPRVDAIEAITSALKV